MKYLSKSFSTPANSKAYVDNWDAVFGKKCRECGHAESDHFIDADGYSNCRRDCNCGWNIGR